MPPKKQITMAFSLSEGPVPFRGTISLQTGCTPEMRHLVTNPYPYERLKQLKRVTIKSYDQETQEWVAGLFTHWKLHRAYTLGTWTGDGIGQPKVCEACCLGYRVFLDRIRRLPNVSPGNSFRISSGDSSLMIQSQNDQDRFHLASQTGSAMAIQRGNLVYGSPLVRYYLSESKEIPQRITVQAKSLSDLNDGTNHLTREGGHSIAWLVIHAVLTRYPWIYLRLPERLQHLRYPQTPTVQ